MRSKTTSCMLFSLLPGISSQQLNSVKLHTYHRHSDTKGKVGQRASEGESEKPMMRSYFILCLLIHACVEISDILTRGKCGKSAKCVSLNTASSSFKHDFFKSQIWPEHIIIYSRGLGEQLSQRERRRQGVKFTPRTTSTVSETDFPYLTFFIQLFKSSDLHLCRA